MDAAIAVHKVAVDAKAELDRRVSQVAGFTQRVIDLSAHITSLSSQKKAAQDRVSQALSAAESLSEAEETLDKTVSAESDLAAYDRLFEMFALQARRTTINSDLSKRIGPQVARRKKLLAEIEQLEGELPTLYQKERGCSNLVSLADQRLSDIRQAIGRHLEHKRLAVELGDAGVCEACGRPFGDDLEAALRHFDHEIGVAQDQETIYTSQLADAQIGLGKVTQKIATRLERITECKLGAKNLEGFVIEETNGRRELSEVEGKLSQMPAQLIDAVYDSARHTQLKADFARRASALADRDKLVPLAALHDEAKNEVAAAAEGIRKLQGQKLTLETRIAAESPSADERTLCEGRLTAAELRLIACRTAFHEAGQQVARAKERVTIARGTLGKSKLQEVAIAGAKRVLAISECTKVAMIQLLEDITTTTRPILAQMIDGWARLFLGHRFQEIELSDDYKIRANNGSGMHNIEHFSGGEQTLLAIMLRVAIAMYCQQNARFDTGFLILDEVFGNQDNEHRRLLVAFLNHIQNDFSQIIIVNHVDDVTEELDKIIDVSATAPNVSTAVPRGYM